MRALTILMLVTVFGLVPLRANGTTYYVAQNGNNAAQGAMDSPWGSLQRASSGLRPGDTVLVRGGVYHERFMPLECGCRERTHRVPCFPRRICRDRRSSPTAN